MFLASVVAQVMTPGLRPFGIVSTTAIGGISFIIATVIGHWLDLYDPARYAGFVATLLAALVILTLYRLAGRRRSRHDVRYVVGYRDAAASRSG